MGLKNVPCWDSKSWGWIVDQKGNFWKGSRELEAQSAPIWGQFHQRTQAASRAQSHWCNSEICGLNFDSLVQPFPKEKWYRLLLDFQIVNDSSGSVWQLRWTKKRVNHKWTGIWPQLAMQFMKSNNWMLEQIIELFVQSAKKIQCCAMKVMYWLTLSR